MASDEFDLDTLTDAQLKATLDHHGLAVSGSKRAKIERLLANNIDVQRFLSTADGKRILEKGGRAKKPKAASEPSITNWGN